MLRFTGRAATMLAALVLSAPTALVAQAAPPDTAPAHAEFLDPIAEVLELPVLRRSGGAPGVRELWIWAEGGQAVTGQLLRLVEKDGKVTGQLAVYWSLDPSEAGAYGGRLDEQMKARWGCAKTAQREVLRDGVIPLRVGACVARFRRAPDWAAVLAKVQQLGAWTLPDHEEDARSGAVSNSEAEAGLVVEARQEGRYRTYHYPSVRSINTDPARQAAAILDVVGELASQADRGGGPPR